ncbi:MAG: DUF1211 domain-containing protein [Terrimonas sp.]|nr:DUF1211 domain-containing protein [Terrimonas sp.]
MVLKVFFRSSRQDDFHYRGKELFRIEALSDAVFAFSVSLLVASLEVPQTFAELKVITKGVIPFFLTISIVFLFWYQQYMFFRRYGLNDLRTIVLNLAYLAVVIFYIYPLKFLFSLLISAWSGIDLFARANDEGLVVLSKEEFPQLIMLFSIGYFLVWLIIFLLHQHVIKLSASFSFTQYEKLLTQKERRGALWNALVGLSALLFAIVHWEVIAGICYLFIPFILWINHYLFRKKVKKYKG